MTTNYYEILGVKASDSAAEIESRYRALALELHPGWSSGDASEAEKSQRLAEATQAFDTLSDADKRAQYDAWLDLSKDSGELPDFEESVRNPNASECMFCAHSPAIQVTFRREVGMLDAITAEALLFFVCAPFRSLAFTFRQAACVRRWRGLICFRRLRLFDLNGEVASFPILGIGPIKREHHFAARL